jgi:hypothetical protein
LHLFLFSHNFLIVLSNKDKIEVMIMQLNARAKNKSFILVRHFLSWPSIIVVSSSISWLLRCIWYYWMKLIMFNSIRDIFVLSYKAILLNSFGWSFEIHNTFAWHISQLIIIVKHHNFTAWWHFWTVLWWSSRFFLLHEII